jgi:hypothetical protein
LIRRCGRFELRHGERAIGVQAIRVSAIVVEDEVIDLPLDSFLWEAVVLHHRVPTVA